MSTLKAKLMPTRFSEMSPLMAAIVGYVLGESFTTPEIAEITVGKSDNLVCTPKAARDRGFSIRCNSLCGSVNNVSKTLGFASNLIFIFSWYCRLSQCQTPQQRHNVAASDIRHNAMVLTQFRGPPFKGTSVFSPIRRK
jgi:hypothetical protein